MTAIRDLWPRDLGLMTKANAPSTILRTQADILEKRTEGLVKAEVISSGIGSPQSDLYFYFNIVAPALNNYRYRLFSIWHDADLYPVMFDLDSDIETELKATIKQPKGAKIRRNAKQPISADTEQEFVEILHRILTSEKTARVVGNLLSLVKESNSNLKDLNSLAEAQ